MIRYNPISDTPISYNMAHEKNNAARFRITSCFLFYVFPRTGFWDFEILENDLYQDRYLVYIYIYTVYNFGKNDLLGLWKVIQIQSWWR